MRIGHTKFSRNHDVEFYLTMGSRNWWNKFKKARKAREKQSPLIISVSDAQALWLILKRFYLIPHGSPPHIERLPRLIFDRLL